MQPLTFDLYCVTAACRGCDCGCATGPSSLRALAACSPLPMTLAVPDRLSQATWAPATEETASRLSSACRMKPSTNRGWRR